MGADVKVLNRFIVIEVLKSASIALLILLALVTFITFTDELKDVGKGDYGLAQIFQYLLLILPRTTYELMPSAALLGSLMALGAIANNREIVAMRAAGVSISQIIAAVLRAGLVMVLFSMLIGEFVAPASEQAAQILKTTAQKKQIAMRTKYGFWVRDGNSYINIRQIHQENELENIYIYDLDDNHRMHRASHASRAAYQSGQWLLEGLTQSEFKDNQVLASDLPETEWSSRLNPDILSIVTVKPDNLSLAGLAKYVRFLKENGQESSVFELAFWNRLFNPLSTLVMLLIALPFVLGFRRITSFGQRVMVGVLVGIGFSLFDRTFGHLGLVYNLNPLFAAGFPIAIFFVSALVAIKRLR